MTNSRLMFAALAGLAGCAVDLDEDLSTTTEELGGSHATLTATGELEAVVRIPGCSATLISQDTVLTASHCVCDDNGCDARSSVTFTNALPRGETVRRDVTVGADVLVHPDFGAGGWLTNDYTLLHLDTPANQLVTKVAPIAVSNALPSVGETHMLVGYGRPTTSAPCDGSYGTKRKGNTVLDSIYVYGGIGGRSLVYKDDLLYACPGDSGGAAISTTTGRLVGVASSADFGNTSNYDATSEAWPWIRANACNASDAAATSATCRQGPALAVGYRDASFGGIHQAFAAGRWPSSDIGELGNDRLTSLTVSPGAIVRLWAEGSCWGDTAVFENSTSNVGTLLDNRTSCIEVSPGVTLYTSNSYAGTHDTFPIGGLNHTQLGAIGNDNAASLVAAPGIIVRVCSESGAPGTSGWGTCRYFSGSVSSLGTLDDAVSNIEVMAGVTVYRDRDFGGVSQTLRPGTWGSSSLTTVGNDAISSLVVGPGLQARICSENGGWGDCQTFTGAVSALTSLLDNRTSNIEITAIP